MATSNTMDAFDRRAFGTRRMTQLRSARLVSGAALLISVFAVSVCAVVSAGVVAGATDGDGVRV